MHIDPSMQQFSQESTETWGAMLPLVADKWGHKWLERAGQYLHRGRAREWEGEGKGSDNAQSRIAWLSCRTA